MIIVVADYNNTINTITLLWSRCLSAPLHFSLAKHTHTHTHIIHLQKAMCIGWMIEDV